MITLIAQNAPPMDRLRGIRDRFAEGGSSSEVLLALFGVAMLLVLAYAIVEFRKRRSRALYSPDRVFEQLLREIISSHQQRHLLRRIARERKLPHPAVLLLSADLLESHANQWMGDTEIDAVRQQVAAAIATVRRGSTVS